MNRNRVLMCSLVGSIIAFGAIFLLVRSSRRIDSDIPNNVGIEPSSTNGDEDDETIFGAIARGDKDKASSLLARGADADSRTSDGDTALQEAVALGRDSIAELLIRHGASVNAQDQYGDTALHIAAFAKDVPCVALLLKNGALPNIETRSGETPLFDAVRYGVKDIVEMLLAAGASLDPKNRGGYTCMHVLASECRNGQDAVACMKLLVEHGADINVDTEMGTPLMCAVYEGGSFEIIKYLLCNGGHIGRMRANSDVIHWAAEKGRVDVVQYLLSQSTDVNLRAAAGLTPLHYAAFSWQHAVAQLLISQGALVDAQGVDGSTPLYKAVESLVRMETYCRERQMVMPKDDEERSMRTIECLLTAGADVRKEDKGGKTPLSCAVSGGLGAVVALMERRAGRK